MKGAGLVEAKSGKVRILTRTELQRGWNPESGRRITVWEATQHLVKALDEDGEQAVAALVKKLGSKAEDARSLAYRLFTLCEKRGWANEAKAYNALVVAWNEIAKIAA